jgi:FkbM family methyltransferase
MTGAKMSEPPTPVALETSVDQTVRVAGLEFVVRSGSERRRFWDRVAAGGWEPQTFRVFQRFLTPGSSCIDIGAWIGPTTLYAAHLADRVLAIEPDLVAHAELAANVAANPALRSQIALYGQCIAPKAGPVDLYAGGMYHSTDSRFGDSMSGLLPTGSRGDQPRQWAEGVLLEDFMADNAVAGCGLIKMDVEGGEYRLIPGRWRRLAAHAMPTLCVSFHAPEPAQRRELIGACLEELRSCYVFLYSATDQATLDVGRTLAGVRDWGDEAPGSDWRALDRRLGDGLVASNGAW